MATYDDDEFSQECRSGIDGFAGFVGVPHKGYKLSVKTSAPMAPKAGEGTRFPWLCDGLPFGSHDACIQHPGNVGGVLSVPSSACSVWHGQWMTMAYPHLEACSAIIAMIGAGATWKWKRDAPHPGCAGDPYKSRLPEGSTAHQEVSPS